MPPQNGRDYLSNQLQPSAPQPQVAPANFVAPAAAPSALPPTPTPLSVPNQQPVAGATNAKKGAPAPHGNPNSTQNALIISEIRDNMVIVNDGSMRGVVACQSINFDLMSDREREAVEYSYQQFLNSLYFPVQILIRSQKVDLGPYLEQLDKIRRDQSNMLLGVLMDDYIAFIADLAQETNIMAKTFYIVVPYYPSGDMSSAVNNSRSFLSNLFSPQKQQHIRIDEAAFNKAKEEIKNRVSTITGGLGQLGIRSVQLNTKQLGELYYNTYNPDTAVREPIGDFENLTAPLITKGQGAAPQPQLNQGQW